MNPRPLANTSAEVRLRKISKLSTRVHSLLALTQSSGPPRPASRAPANRRPPSRRRALRSASRPGACPRVPLVRVARGQQRSLTSLTCPYPQVRIRARQALDRCPTFQAGAPVPISGPSADFRTSERAEDPDNQREREPYLTQVASFSGTGVEARGRGRADLQPPASPPCSFRTRCTPLLHTRSPC
jgi:hypothetical protein